MIFWAGLRGAVAFALAYNIKGSAGAWLRTTILCVVVISVIAFGGTTSTMLTRLGVRTGVHEDKESDSEAEDGDGEEERGHGIEGDVEGRRSANGEPVYIDWGDDDANVDPGPAIASSVQDGIHGMSTSSPALPGGVRNSRDEGHWFLAFDNRYIKPFLSRISKPSHASQHHRSSANGSYQERLLDVHIPSSSRRQSRRNETSHEDRVPPSASLRAFTPSPLPNDGEFDPDPLNLLLSPLPTSLS